MAAVFLECPRVGKEAEVITKDLVKSEIDKVPEENLGVLFRIVKALEEPTQVMVGESDEIAWKTSIAEAYGSTSDALLERGPQGSYEAREPLE
jgi:hypothetical protein